MGGRLEEVVVQVGKGWQLESSVMMGAVRQPPAAGFRCFAVKTKGGGDGGRHKAAK